MTWIRANMTSCHLQFPLKLQSNGMSRSFGHWKVLGRIHLELLAMGPLDTRLELIKVVSNASKSYRCSALLSHTDSGYKAHFSSKLKVSMGPYRRARSSTQNLPALQNDPVWLALKDWVWLLLLVRSDPSQAQL